jgi:hypothetical protein
MPFRSKTNYGKPDKFLKDTSILLLFVKGLSGSMERNLQIKISKLVDELHACWGQAIPSLLPTIKTTDKQLFTTTWYNNINQHFCNK